VKTNRDKGSVDHRGRRLLVTLLVKKEPRQPKKEVDLSLEEKKEGSLCE